MHITLQTALAKYDMLSKQQVEEVVNSAVARSYKKGAYFLKACEMANEIGFLLAGVFRYYTVDESGNESTFMFITEASFFTELESFHQEDPARGYLQAETDADVLVFDRNTYRHLISEIKGMEYVFKRHSQETLINQLTLARAIVTLDAKKAYLLLLNKFPSIVSRVPDNHLASFMGITKHSLSRIKKKITDLPN